MTVFNNDDTDTNDNVEGDTWLAMWTLWPVAGPGAHIRSVWAQQCGNVGTMPPMLTWHCSSSGVVSWSRPKQTRRSSSSTLERSSSCCGCSNNSPGNCGVSRHVTWSLCLLTTTTGTWDTGYRVTANCVHCTGWHHYCLSQTINVQLLRRSCGGHAPIVAQSDGIPSMNQSGKHYN